MSCGRQAGKEMMLMRYSAFMKTWNAAHEGDTKKS